MRTRGGPAVVLTLACLTAWPASPAAAAAPGTIAAIGGPGGCSLTVVRASDGRRTRCVKLRGVGINGGSLAIAPGGDRVAFYSGSPKVQDSNGVVEVDLRTGKRRTLLPTSFGISSSASSPSYSPDGERLAVDGSGTAAIGSPDGSSQIITLASGARIPATVGGFDALRFSPDGQRVFGSSTFPSEIESMPTTGGPAVPFGRVVAGDRDRDRLATTFSFDVAPDGGRVAFVRDGPNGPSGVPDGPDDPPAELVVQAPGGEPQVIASGPAGASEGDVRWSPDGGLLAVSWKGPFGPGGSIVGRLELLRPDGTGRRTTKAVGLFEPPTWGPKGRFVVGNRQNDALIITRSGRVSRPKALRGTVQAVVAAENRRTVAPPLPPDPAPVPGTSSAPPVPVVDPRCVPKVDAGNLQALAQCFVRQRDGTFSATGRVRVNGLDVVPAGSGRIVVDPRSQRVRSSGQVVIRLGPIRLTRSRIDWRGDVPIAFSLESGDDKDPRDNVIGGLKVKGSIGVTFGDGKLAGKLSVELPRPFEGLTTDVEVAADNQRGLILEGVTATLDYAPVGPAEIRDAEVALSSADGGRWEGGATFYPAAIQAFAIKGVLGYGAGGYFKLGGGVDGLNKPLVGGVFFQRANAELTVNPFSIQGGIGVTYGPQLKLFTKAPQAAASLDGSFRYESGAPSTFTLSGEGKAAGATFKGDVAVTTDGAVDASGEAEWKEPVTGRYGISAKIEGWYEDRAFEVKGSAKLSLPGLDAGGDGILSSAGIGACRRGLGPDFGIGYGWESGKLKVVGSSCGLGDWTVQRPSAQSRQVGGPAPGASFVVRRGQPTIAFSAIGAQGAPKVTLTGPGGLQVATPADPAGAVDTPKAVLFQDQIGRTTYVVIDRPAPGRYRLAPQPGTAAVTTFRSAAPRAPVRIRATTRRARGGARTLTWAIRDLDGGSVAFVEEGRGVRRVLTTTRRARGRVRFRASAGVGGRRRIRAVITQDGLPQGDRSVVRFSTSRVRPDPPRNVRIVRGATAVTVRWRGPVRSAYRITLRTADGRNMRLGVPASRRAARRIRVTAIPRSTTVRVQVRRLATVGGLSRPAGRSSRGR